jgi:hypothetical protein
VCVFGCCADEAYKTPSEKFVDRKIYKTPVVLFSKAYTPECRIVKEALKTFQ